MGSLRLGQKLLVLAVAASLAYSGALFLVLAAMTDSRFARLESEFVRADLGRAESYLRERESGLATSAQDYAAWDEARSFVLGKKPGFLADNVNDTALANLGLSFVAVYRRDGSLAGVAPASSMAAGLVPDRFEGGPPATSGYGRRLLGGAVFLVGVAPVTSSDGTAEAAGTMFFARAVDPAFVAKMNIDLGLNVAIGEAGGQGLGFDASRVQSDDRYVGITGGKAFGFLVIRDSTGVAVAVLRTESPRTVTSAAADMRLALALSSFAILGLVVFFGALAVQLLITRPLERLEAVLESESPGTMGEGVDGELVRIGARSDAIGRMACVLVEARRRIRESAEAVIYMNSRLESQVEERTGELRRANYDLRLYRKIMQGTSEGVIVTDLSGNILEMNDAFLSAHGYLREELIGRNARALKSGRHDDPFYEGMRKAISAEGRWAGEVWNRRKSGEIFPEWLAIDTILDEEGRPEGFVGLSSDLSELKKAEDRLSRAAFYDSLTGLPNRSLFHDRLAQSILRAQRSLSRCALLFIDLDRFKDINDSLGHAPGDALLVEVARRLAAAVRVSDTVCRLGGDEFVVILEEIDRSEAAGEVANKLIHEIEKPFAIADVEVYVGASVGISLFPYDGTEGEALLQKADAAMSEAKESGRGQFRYAAGLAGDDSRRRIEVEANLRRALENGKFCLVYQPQVSAGAARAGSGDGLVGAEALIRMRRPDGSIAPPGEFIDVAEDSGLIVQIGEWALGEACREAREWAGRGRRIVMSVNVSPRQFERGDLVGAVRAALDATGLEPSLLKLEVTESLFMRKLEDTIGIMNRIKAMGVSFAVDDFGIGFSSLQYLNRLPVDYIKIDKAFIDEMGDEFEGGEIATAVISLSRAFGFSSIAEGVEREDQLEALKRRGCDEIQGYLVSRPLDSDAFRRFAFGS